jgi:hypothetical protein
MGKKAFIAEFKYKEEGLDWEDIQVENVLKINCSTKEKAINHFNTYAKVFIALSTASKSPSKNLVVVHNRLSKDFSRAFLLVLFFSLLRGFSPAISTVGLM